MEFVANNDINVSTGHTPFYLNFDIHPISPTSMLYQQNFSTNETATAMICSNERGIGGRTKELTAIPNEEYSAS